MPFILGTAGHIDHGKTALVRALTGIDCDRLAEEKKRGITIELGFAWMDLPDGQRLGIVDVPGHERFVKNMVAGAAGIDVVMLVIAADEGVMPQTREHLDICSLLGIRTGFVALTKRDLVDDDWLALVREDVAAFTKGTFLEGCPVVPVSSVTGEGLDEVRATITKLAQILAPEHRSDIFRLPVDRVFSLRGFGTVVTGTVISGRVQKDSDAVMMPAGLPTHIRTLQRHETPTDEAHAGERCAANVQNLEVADVHRGYVLALPGTLFPSKRFLVHLRCLESSPLALRNRTQLHFHHGTLETLARIVLFDRPVLKPGEETLCEMRFDSPLVGVFGDHCVLRASSPLRAVAGGSVISPLPPQLRARDPQRESRFQALARLAEMERVNRSADDAERVELVLRLQGNAGADEALLRVLTGLSRKRLDRALQTLTGSGRCVCFDREKRGHVDAGAFAALCSTCLERAKELHDKAPLQAGFARTALETGWSADLPPKLVARVFDSLLREGRLQAAGELVKLPGREISLTKKQQELARAIRSVYAEAGSAPPNFKDVAGDLRVSEKEALPVFNVLCAQGALVRVREGIYYDARALADIVAGVEKWFADHDDLTLADMKTITGLSRKYLIALLEYLDEERITVRIGDKRQFRSQALP